MNQARTWTIGLVVVVLLIIVGGWQLGISPIVDQINTANTQAATIQTSNSATESQLASLKLQYAHIGKLRAKLNTLRLSIPEQAAASSFISEVTALAASTGVTVQSVDISAATDYATSSTGDSTTTGTTSSSTTSTATPTTPGATAPAPTGGGLVELGVTVNASGPYLEAQKFMGLLQTGTRLFVVNTSSLTGSGTTSDGTAVLTGNIFTLQGTSDPATSTGSGSGSTSTPTPYPTLTPTATPTPTPTPTTSGTSTKKSTSTPTPSPSNGS